jgi:hypothetical protein
LLALVVIGTEATLHTAALHGKESTAKLAAWFAKWGTVVHEIRTVAKAVQ